MNINNAMVKNDVQPPSDSVIQAKRKGLEEFTDIRMNAIQPNLAPNPSGPNKAKGKVPMVIVLIPSPIPYSTAKIIKPAKVAPKPNKIENPSVIKPKEIKLVIKGCSAPPKINSKNRPAVLAGPINAPAVTATAALCPNASTLLIQSDIKAPIIYPEKVKDSTIQIMA